MKCEEFEVTGASSAQLCAVKRHRRDSVHVAAAGSERSAILLRGQLVPSCAAFTKCFRLIHQGKAARDTEIAKRSKFQRMRRCLAEAIRRWQHSKMRSAKVMSLMQDGRKNFLAAMFNAADGECQTTMGVLGILDISKLVFTTTAQHFAKATTSLLARACSRFDKAHRPDQDAGLLAHVINIVEVFTADGAYDEQLAGRILKGRQLGQDFTEASVLIHIFRHTEYLI